MTIEAIHPLTPPGLDVRPAPSIARSIRPAETYHFALVPDPSSRLPETAGAARRDGWSARPERWRARLIGEIDCHARQCLNDLIGRIANTGAAVHLDLSEVTFMDASGIGLLVALRNQLIETGGDLILEQVTVRTERLLRISGADVLRLPAAD